MVYHGLCFEFWDVLGFLWFCVFDYSLFYILYCLPGYVFFGYFPILFFIVISCVLCFVLRPLSHRLDSVQLFSPVSPLCFNLLVFI